LEGPHKEKDVGCLTTLSAGKVSGKGSMSQPSHKQRKKEIFIALQAKTKDYYDTAKQVRERPGLRRAGTKDRR